MTLMGFDLEGQVIRPPAEAESLLLQATLGCSHNHCAFCPAYKDKRFGFKEPERLRQAMDHAALHMPFLRRVSSVMATRSSCRSRAWKPCSPISASVCPR